MPKPTPDPAAILTIVQRILVEQLGCEPENATPETSLVSLGADSLDSVEIIMAVEEQWDIDILDEEAEEIRTVAQVVELIRSKTAPGN
jgi:acyl carrier protein